MFFTLRFRKEFFVGVYSKLEKTVKISKHKYGDSSIRHGIKNDIDGFISFHPISIDDNKIVGITLAEDASAWFENNQNKIQALPNELKSYEDIQPEDNPIIVIGTLK